MSLSSDKNFSVGKTTRWKRAEEALMNSFLCNSLPFSGIMMNKFNKKINTVCKLCSKTDDTEHIILNCRKYFSLRKTILGHRVLKCEKIDYWKYIKAKYIMKFLKEVNRRRK